MKIDITFGIGEDRDGNPIAPDVAEANILRIAKLASDLFGGCSLTRHDGAWVNGEGRLVTEPSLTLSVAADGGADPLPLAQYARKLLQQDTVLVQTYASNVQFVAAA
jgi:hypothetical protein